VTAGQRGDAPVFPAVLAAVPDGCPVEEVVGDKAYDSDDIRELLLDEDLSPCIPSKKNRTEPIYHDPERYKERNHVERFFARLKQFRRVATRYDKLKETFLAIVQIVAVFQLIR